jgi:hypothetical protein
MSPINKDPVPLRNTEGPFLACLFFRDDLDLERLDEEVFFEREDCTLERASSSILERDLELDLAAEAFPLPLLFFERFGVRGVFLEEAEEREELADELFFLVVFLFLFGFSSSLLII